MNSVSLVLFDDPVIREQLLPFTYTRPVADIRIGINTIREKWEYYNQSPSYSLVPEYLSAKYPMNQASGPYLFINGSILPDENLWAGLKDLREGECLMKGSVLIGARAMSPFSKENLSVKAYAGEFLSISRPWHIFGLNDRALRDDFARITKGRKSQPLSADNRLLGPISDLFIEEGASVLASVINTGKGPVYIGKEAEVMEGSMIRGPFAMCEHAATKMGSKIYGATTLGPHVKVGGEINNSVIFGYSNKGHDGFLGNSVLGEWCNLGADTNNSNLKNNYGEVKIWSYYEMKEVSTGLQFCGLFMGDHSKSGINSMFNTGTVVGVATNIFGGDFPPKHVPSFSWGGSQGFTEFIPEKAVEIGTRMMERRDLRLSEDDEAILRHVFELTRTHRV